MLVLTLPLNSGVHTHKCRADVSAKNVVGVLQGAQDALFPQSLTVSERSRRMLKQPKENGGWGDVRDHQLCINNTMAPGASTGLT